MAVNLSNRTNQLTIDGVDYSGQIVSGLLRDSAPSNTGGLVSGSGRITLAAVADGGNPVDSYNDPALFAEGTPLALSLTTGDGDLLAYPHALRVIKASYDSATRQNQIAIGDVLALGDRTPTDFEVAGVTPGTGITAKTIIERWAAQAFGISVVWNSSVAFQFGWPPDLKGSYRDSISALLDSMGCVGWIDTQERLIVEDVVAVPQTASIALADDGATIQSFEPTELGDRPAEKLTIVAPFRDVLEREDDTTTEAESFGFNSNGGRAIVRRQSRREQQFFLLAKKVIDEEEFRIGSELYGDLPGYPQNSLQLAQRVSIERTHEQAKSGKLKKVLKVVTGPRISVLGPYLAWLQENDPDRVALENWSGIITLLEEEEIPNYDLTEQIQSITVRRREPAGAILGALGNALNWGNIRTSGVNFSGLRDSFEEVQEYSPDGADAWKFQSTTKQPGARSPNAQSAIAVASEDTPGNAAQRGLGLAVAETDFGESNSGQFTPPAAERRPSQFTAANRQYKTTERFPEFGGYIERADSIKMDYTPDAGVFSAPVDAVGGYISVEAAANRFGKTAGALRKASTRARQYVGLLRSPLLSGYHPLKTADVTYEGVTSRVMLTRQAIAFNNDRLYFKADCPQLAIVEEVEGQPVLRLPYPVTSGVDANAGTLGAEVALTFDNLAIQLDVDADAGAMGAEVAVFPAYLVDADAGTLDADVVATINLNVSADAGSLDSGVLTVRPNQVDANAGTLGSEVVVQVPFTNNAGVLQGYMRASDPGGGIEFTNNAGTTVGWLFATDPGGGVVLTDNAGNTLGFMEAP